jgi:hypothetical protein
MIRNCDGTPYQLSSFEVYDPTSTEHFLLNTYDSEIIDIAGAPVEYYEVFIQTHNSMDPLYREDRGKIFSNNPVKMKCYYEPINSQNFLNMHGVDAPDEMQFLFNYKTLLNAIGHPPKVGARLFTPHKNENWVIIQRNVGEFFLWGELRLTIIAQRFQESTTTGEGGVTQPANNVQLNTGSLLGGGGQ